MGIKNQTVEIGKRKFRAKNARLKLIAILKFHGRKCRDG